MLRRCWAWTRPAAQPRRAASATIGPTTKRRPRAGRAGCTTQACGVRDHRPDYGAAGAVVVGVSPDAVKRTSAFDDKYELGFPLLADEDHEVAEAYGVWVEKSMDGRKYMGMERSTFVISPEGTVRALFRKV